MTEQLAVWLHGTRVALIEKDRKSKFGIRLRYSDEALRTFPLGSPLISLRFPLDPRPFGPAESTAFFQNLLPEGVPLSTLADRFGVAAQDVFGLLAALGLDSAGALVIQPEEDPPPSPGLPRGEALHESALWSLIRGVPTAPLGVQPGVRLSLAGLQGKLLLTRLPNGEWSQPLDGTPSTHIVKLPIQGKPDSTHNEAFCLHLARALGLNVPNSKILTSARDSLAVLVVERYDRRILATGEIQRIHQEDCCQAFGIPPSKKYQAAGGPSLRAVAKLLRAHNPDAISQLFRLVVFNVLIGNADAHAKNVSLIHVRHSTLRLAPFYDLLSTRSYPEVDDQLAMRVGDVRHIDRVTQAHLIAEARGWDIAPMDAEAQLDQLFKQVPDAIVRAVTEVPDVPAALPRLIGARLARLRDGLMTGAASNERM